MRIELINTGTELLLGSVLNSHLAFLGKSLLTKGLRIGRQTCVPDGNDIAHVLLESFLRSDLVLVTGGLGPTTDDLTRDCTAELLGLPLEVDPGVLAAIRERFARRGYALTDRIARQAEVPKGAEVLPNPNGTAPGLYLPPEVGSRQHPHLFLLPGPPRELIPMFDAEVLPRLARIVGAPKLISRTFHLAGIGESQAEAAVGPSILALEDVELGYCARPGEVDVRCIGTPEQVNRASEIILGELAEFVFGEEGTSLETTLIRTLTERRQTVATAESCTGGLLASRLTDVAGASKVFLGGFVPYSNAQKSAALGVPEALIAEHGAVSEPVARALAEGARNRTGADFALATTGIAGPDGGTEEKPVGTVFIALAGPDFATIVERHSFRFDRETFKFITSRTAFNMLRKRLKVA